MISTVTLNPALDKNIYVDALHPNDTNRVLRVETDAGGKGINASRVLKELGSSTVALGFLGGQSGSFIEHVLSTEGIPTDFVRIHGDTRTNISIQELTGAPPTTLNEAGPSVSPDEMNQLFAKVRQVARESKMMLFGGSLAPSAPRDLYKWLVAAAQEEGALAILDSDGEPMVLGMQAKPYMIKPNRDEVKRLVGVDIKSLEDARHALNLLAETGVQLVVISMGAQGAVARSADGTCWHAIPPVVKVVSTVGSGDSMVAGITHVLSQGGSLEDALRCGSAAGAATAMTDGTEIARHDSIVSLLDMARVERLG